MAGDEINIDNINIQVSAVDEASQIITTVQEKLNGLKATAESIPNVKLNLDGLTNLFNAINGVDSSGMERFDSALRSLTRLSDVKISSTISTNLNGIADAILNIGAATELVNIEDVTNVLNSLGRAVSGGVTMPAVEMTSTASSTEEASVQMGRYASAASEAEVATQRTWSWAERINTTLADVSNFSRWTATNFSNLATSTVSLAKKLGGVVSKVMQIRSSLSLSHKIMGAIGTRIKTTFSRLTTMIKRRVMYRAINAVISAITNGVKTGINNLYQYSKAFNGSFSKVMDELSTESLYLKNSLGAAFGVLIELAAPYIELVIEKFVGLLNVVNQVMARLQGKATWTRAVKYPKEYAEAADSATEANEKLKKSILGLDEINPLTDNSKSSSGKNKSSDNYGLMFVEDTFDDINKASKGLADFFTPFRKAWENQGQPTINATKNAFSGIMGLAGSVKGSISEIWQNGTGQKTVENILRIYQGISNTVGNIARKIQIAWDKNGTGAKILQNIWDIANIVLGTFASITEERAKWAESLDFTPLLTSIEKFTAKVKPLVEAVGKLFEWVNKEIIEPFLKWFIEEFAPTFIDTASALIDAITKILEPVIEGLKPVFEALKPFIEWLGDFVITILQGLQKIFEKIADVFNEKGDKIVEIFEKIAVIIDKVWEVAGPVFDFLLDALEIIFDFLATVVGSGLGMVIDVLSGILDFVTNVFKGDWEGAWNSIGSVFSGVWDGIKGIASGLITFFSSIWEKIKAPAIHVWEVIKTAVTGIFNSMVWVIKQPINAVLGFVESLANGVISGLNFMIRGLNSLSIDIPDWVPGVGGGKLGFNISEIAQVSIPRLETGGFVDRGQMFIANESGAELVGQIGNRTAVANSQQIVEGIKMGVQSANDESNQLLREQNNLLASLLAKDSNVRVSDIITGLRQYNRRVGKTVIEVN